MLNSALQVTKCYTPVAPDSKEMPMSNAPFLIVGPMILTSEDLLSTVKILSVAVPKLVPININEARCRDLWLS